MKKKTVVLLLAVVLAFGIAAGGTLAWLMDRTDAVENTFTTSDVDIELSEDAGGEDKKFQMIPGHIITKDPKVTVKAGSEKCFVFVKVQEANWPTCTENDGTRKVDYKIAEGWTELENATDDGSKVYYRVQDAVSADTAEENLPVFEILKDNQVTVSSTMTKAEMEAIKTEPTLTFKAYACQYMKDRDNVFEAEDAWNIVKDAE